MLLRPSSSVHSSLLHVGFIPSLAARWLPQFTVGHPEGEGRTGISSDDTLLGARRSFPTCLTSPRRAQRTEWEGVPSDQSLARGGVILPPIRLTSGAGGWSHFARSRLLRGVGECLTPAGLPLGSVEAGHGCWVGKQQSLLLPALSNTPEFITSREPANPVYIHRLITRASLLKIWAGEHGLC